MRLERQAVGFDPIIARYDRLAISLAPVVRGLGGPVLGVRAVH